MRKVNSYYRKLEMDRKTLRCLRFDIAIVAILILMTNSLYYYYHFSPVTPAPLIPDDYLTPREAYRKSQLQKAMEGLKDNSQRGNALRDLNELQSTEDDFYWPVMEVLTTFLREASPCPSIRKDGTCSNGGSQGQGAMVANITVRETIEIIKTRAKGFGFGEKEPLRLDKTDLRGADLGGADLVGANLEGTNLGRIGGQDTNLSLANLKGASLAHADLSYVNLFNSKCQEVDFSWGILRNAVLSRANLSGAKFKMANLQFAFLTDSQMQGADMSGAYLKDAHLLRTDLRGANLAGLKWRGIAEIANARIKGVKNAPKGFREWAIANGAIEDD